MFLYKTCISLKRTCLFIFTLSALALISVSYGCSKDDDKFSVSGTKWTRSVNDEIETISFVSETDCQLYSTTTDGTLTGSVMEGKYSINNNEIIFSQEKDEFLANLTGVLLINPTRHQFKTGNVSGEFLTIIATTEEMLIDYSHYSEDQHVSYTINIKDDVKYTFKKIQ